MKIDRYIFRAYDIRGHYPSQLNEDIAFLLGQAVADMMRDKGCDVIATARDARLSSPNLHQAVNRGLQYGGVRVVDVAQAPTPVLYFAALTLAEGSGIVVTGSHNPADDNGFKIMIDGETLFGNAIEKLYQRIIQDDFPKNLEQLDIIHNDALTPYCKKITSDITLARPLKIAVDCGNGVTGIIAETLFKSLGVDVVALFTEMDGHFPNHHPDPSQPENLRDVIEQVKKQQCDFGIAFDGDGDRIAIIDEQGQIIPSDQLLMFLAQDVLSRHAGGTVIFDVKCSRHLSSIIEKAGGKPIMWKTGHSLIKAKMKQEKALLAGEMSGHIFFAERWFGFDDALYTACRFCEMIAVQSELVSKNFVQFPKDVATPELKIAVGDDQKLMIIERLTTILKKTGLPLSTLDGVRIDVEKGWGLIRCSNTTPNLILRFEAETDKDLDYIRMIMLNALHKAAPSIQFDGV